MHAEVEKIRTATEFFYQAIEAMSSGEGLEKMCAAWHQTPRATTSHPAGDWSIGWAEINTSWEVFATFGAPDRGGSSISNLQVHNYGGDLAYTTCVFQASPAFSGDKVNCTNVLHRVDGVWKIIHHHPDRSPEITAAFEKLASQ